MSAMFRAKNGTARSRCIVIDSPREPPPSFAAVLLCAFKCTRTPDIFTGGISFGGGGNGGGKTDVEHDGSMQQDAHEQAESSGIVHETACVLVFQ